MLRNNLIFKKKHGVLRTFKIIIGILISSFGTSILYQLYWGSSPGSTASEGLKLFFDISYGLGNAIINIICLIAILIWARDLIGMGTILAPLVFSLSIDGFLSIVKYLNISDMHLALKILMLLIGTTLKGAGSGYYVAQNYGTGAIDGISVLLNRKLDIPFVYARWGMDGAQMLLGILLGASWGIGTVASLVLISPVMNFVLNNVRTDYDD